MMSTTGIVWCLVLVYGVSCESPTPSPDQWWVESSVSEEPSPIDLESEGKGTASSEPLHYEFPPKDSSDETEWTAYSPEVYPLFRIAVTELSASEHGILMFWDILNQLENPQEIVGQVFTAYNHLITADSSSSTTEDSQEATIYHLETTDPHGSEVVTDAYTAEDEASSVDDSSDEYHSTTASHEGDEAAMYYTTESPTLEAMLTDEAIYASAVSSEDPEDSTDEDNYGYATNEDVYETTSEDLYEATSQDDAVEDEATSQDVVEDEESTADESESADNVSESEWENIVRRSGVFVEEDSSPEDAQCEGCPLQVGSIRGIPGVHFPNYDDIPITSFSCADKRVPGFYADLETGCQVFHVCWPHRRESFLCPIGTLFNQAILACDYWYSTNCSLSSLFFDVTTLSPTTPHEKPTTSKLPKTTKTPKVPTPEASTERHTTESYIVEHTEVPDERPHVDEDWFRISKFLPVKSKVTVYKHSSKKPGSKWVVKQKHDVLPLVEEFLALTKNVAEKAIHLVPEVNVHVVKPAISKPKLVKVKPAAKLEPCLKIKDLKIKPTPTVVKKPQPVPKLDPRFIVKPVVGKRPPVTVYVKKGKLVLPKVPVKHVKPLGIKVVKTSKHHAPQIVMKALNVAGNAANVLQRDILDLTRQAIVDSHVGSLKTKH